jgi:hypothetical protein
MPYTGHPLTIDRDAVRHMIGDKDNEDLLLTDEEIDFHLAEHGDNKLLAAAECAEAIAAMPRMQQPQAGDSGGTPVTRADHYLRLARQLRSREVVVEEEEEEANILAKPGYSSKAINRGALFKREEGL